MVNSAPPRKIFSLHPNIFFLGLVSLLTDVSSEMIFTLVPLFLGNVLGVSATLIGVIGGLTGSTDAFLRIYSGRLCDKVRKRKMLAGLGYSLSAVAKPFMLLASAWGAVLAVRFVDRAGKGIRTSPRDALVADSLELEERGKGFGLHRAMDTSGAVIGLALAALIIYVLQGGGLKLDLSTYRWLVIFGIVPAVLSIIVLFVFVRERRKNIDDSACLKSETGGGVKLGRRFKIFLVIVGIFTLGNSGEFFVILRAQDIGSSVLVITLMLVLFNIAYALVSMPAGMLSDRLGRKKVIIIGWTVYVLIYLGFALASNAWQIWLLIAGYGVYFGIVEGVSRAFVADLVPEEKRGTAYGLFNGVMGFALLPAAVGAGWLWDNFNHALPFFAGAGLAFIAMLGMLILVRE